MPTSIPAASLPPAGIAPSTAAADAVKPPRPLRRAEHFGVMFLMLLLSTGSATLVGVLAAFLYLLSGRGTLPDTALRFAATGAMVGVFVGLLTCVHYLTALRAPPRAS